MSRRSRTTIIILVVAFLANVLLTAGIIYDDNERYNKAVTEWELEKSTMEENYSGTIDKVIKDKNALEEDYKNIGTERNDLLMEREDLFKKIKELEDKIEELKASKKETASSSSSSSESVKKGEESKNGKQIGLVLSFYGSGDDENGAGNGNATASGADLSHGVIASNNFPFNTEISIDGYGTYTVLDTGNPQYLREVSDNKYKIDVYVPKNSNESVAEYKQRISNYGIVETTGYVLN